jgi:hypothetical protein
MISIHQTKKYNRLGGLDYPENKQENKSKLIRKEYPRITVWLLPLMVTREHPEIYPVLLRVFISQGAYRVARFTATYRADFAEKFDPNRKPHHFV